MKIVIGIVTHQRSERLLSLLKQLAVQLKGTDQVWVLENGSYQLSKKQIKSIHSHISLFHLPTASIPKARNTLFKKAKKSASVLVFIDDDVSLPKNWLLKIRRAIKQAEKNKAEVVQGNFHSLPQQNIYAQTTEILNQLWLNVNLLPNSLTRIIDTKHVIFLLKYFRKRRTLFDEKMVYASDIAASAELIATLKIKILFLPKLLVFHHERSSWWAFTKHRFRLSFAFRRVDPQYPYFFQSATTKQKFGAIWSELPTNVFGKVWMSLNLCLIYGAVFVNTSITSLLRD